MKAWQKTHLYTYGLLIFAWAFQCVALLRRFWFQQIKKPKKFNVPVVVVGNISVGGTGKTPVVAALAQVLKEKGWAPGIVMRGYKSKLTRNQTGIVLSDSPASVYGDEPVLLAQKTACPISIGVDRPQAVALLLAKFPAVNIIISDDGLQHYALARDIEIAVIDGSFGLGNGFCLPAGPLRESPARLKTVDFCLVNGASAALQLDNPAVYHYVPCFDPDLTLLGNNLLKMPITQLIGKTVHAIAGIGAPTKFFTMLSALGLKVIPHPFADHYAYKREDLIFADDYPVLMTHKDAVKCSEFNLENSWVVALTVTLPAAFTEQFLRYLKRE